MNERIKKLVVESNGYWEHGDHNMPSTICFQEADLEKFAELIVRECMEIAYEYDAPKMSGPGMIVANRIQDQFGLDEVLQ